MIPSLRIKFTKKYSNAIPRMLAWEMSKRLLAWEMLKRLASTVIDKVLESKELTCLSLFNFKGDKLWTLLSE